VLFVRSVYANGDEVSPPRRVTLPNRILSDVDEVMEEINKYVKLSSGSAVRLYVSLLLF